MTVASVVGQQSLKDNVRGAAQFLAQRLPGISSIVQQQQRPQQQQQQQLKAPSIVSSTFSKVQYGFAE